MQWIPRQYRSYVLSNIYLWMGRLALSFVSVYTLIGGSSMFTNIPEIFTVIGLCALAVVAWIVLVQYSKWQQHIKSNVNSSEAKQQAAKDFAFIPYLVIPVLFGAVAVTGGLWVADLCAVKGWFSGVEEIAVVAVIASVVIDCVLGKYLVSHVGDAVYFATIENKVAEVVEEFPGISEEDKELLRLLKKLKS